MRAVFRMPGNRSEETAASCSAVSITAYGAQGTPQATKWAFSRALSCATDTALAAGDTGRCAASAASAAAGTFSNSVVTASDRRGRSARPRGASQPGRVGGGGASPGGGGGG